MRPLLCIVLYSILLSYKGCSQASRFCRFISWTRSRFTPTLFKPWTANINILDVVAYIDAANTNIRKFKRKYLSQMIDFTAGASQLSMPYAETVSNMSIATVSSQQSIDGSTITTTPTKISPLLRIHQLSKKVIKKVPDNILLGILVLISSELLQREVSSKSSIIPPLLQSVANTTIFELDTKLELLSELQWDFDPFIQAEVERLQTQPLEAIDRFLVTDVLPKVDRELSPILSKLIADPAKAKVVTNNIKEIIQITTFLVLRPTKSSSKSQTIQDKILESVDVVGKNIEDGLKEWNRAIEDLSKVVKADSIITLLSTSQGGKDTPRVFNWIERFYAKPPLASGILAQDSADAVPPFWHWRYAGRRPLDLSKPENAAPRSL